jgi:hypothetical protein
MPSLASGPDDGRMGFHLLKKLMKPTRIPATPSIFVVLRCVNGVV